MYKPTLFKNSADSVESLSMAHRQLKQTKERMQKKLLEINHEKTLLTQKIEENKRAAQKSQQEMETAKESCRKAEEEHRRAFDESEKMKRSKTEKEKEFQRSQQEMDGIVQQREQMSRESMQFIDVMQKPTPEPKKRTLIIPNAFGSGEYYQVCNDYSEVKRDRELKEQLREKLNQVQIKLDELHRHLIDHTDRHFNVECEIDRTGCHLKALESKSHALERNKRIQQSTYDEKSQEVQFSQQTAESLRKQYEKMQTEERNLTRESNELTKQITLIEREIAQARSKRTSGSKPMSQRSIDDKMLEELAMRELAQEQSGNSQGSGHTGRI